MPHTQSNHTGQGETIFSWVSQAHWPYPSPPQCPWAKNRLQPFDPLSPHKDCVVQSSFEITLFLLKHILPHYSLARLPHWRKDCLGHDRSQNFLGHQSPSLFSENSPSNVLQTDVKCRSDVTKWLSLGYSWPSVSTCVSRIVAFKLQQTCWHALTWGRWL